MDVYINLEKKERRTQLRELLESESVNNGE